MRTLVVVPVSLCVLFGAMAQDAFAQAASSMQKPTAANLVPLAPTPDISVALPTALNLTGFGEYKADRITDQNVQVKAVRKSDGLTLEVELFGCPDETAANRIFTVFQNGSSVPLQQTSWSGRKLAQKVNRSTYADNIPKESYSLLLQDGRTVIHIRLTGPYRRDARGEVVRDENGELILYRFTNADLLYAENIGQQVLDRMTALGFGSKPASEATTRAKQEIQKRKKQAPVPTKPENP